MKFVSEVVQNDLLDNLSIGVSQSYRGSSVFPPFVQNMLLSKPEQVCDPYWRIKESSERRCLQPTTYENF